MSILFDLRLQKVSQKVLRNPFATPSYSQNCPEADGWFYFIWNDFGRFSPENQSWISTMASITLLRLRIWQGITSRFGQVWRDAMLGVPKRRIAGLHKRGTTQQRARQTQDKSGSYFLPDPYAKPLQQGA